MRTPAHSAGDEYVYALLGEVIDRRHTSSLDMGHVGNHFDFFDFTIFHRHERVKVTVTEMGAQGGFQPSGV